MSKILLSIAALSLMGAASLPLQANAAERHDGVTNANKSTEFSAQRHWRRHYGYRHYGPRRFYGPRYGFYGYPYYGSPYGYYGPGIAFGFGPFGFRAF